MDVGGLLKAASRGDKEAQCRLGQCYSDGKHVAQDPEEAVYWFERAADQGSAPAQCKLGGCYVYGTGVAKDEARAFELYTKAAEQGSAVAQCYLGECYGEGTGVAKDEARAFELYTKAADQGHAGAQNNLGVCYTYGKGVAKDEARAVELYRKAADQGNAAAQCYLGECYGEGIRVVKDEARAVELFRKAADKGDATAQFNLGLCYANGRGVAKDEARAVELYTKAAELGSEDAQINLGVCYTKGTGVVKDEARAVELYAKATDQGNAAAQFNLGECYENGTGVAKDEAHAVELYTKAANQGDADAQSNLGVCYANGRGVAKDEARAVELYTKAADQGSADAQFNLGVCYQTGRWVAKDEARAVELFTKAADQGHARAQCNLGVCYEEGIGVAKDEARAVELYTKAADQGHACAQGKLAERYAKGLGGLAQTPERTPPPDPQPELLEKLKVRLIELERQGALGSNLVLTSSQREYLGRMLGREGNMKAIENERQEIIKDPRMQSYYHGLQQSLCWMFAGAQACKSGLVKHEQNLRTTGLIQASSKLAGLLPVYGHLAQGVVQVAGEQIADYFAGKNAERIARAAGTDGALVAEGVARYLVFARKGVLLAVPRVPVGACEKEVSKMVREDVEKMMGWVKCQKDLGSIRKASDLTGEGVVQKLVGVAEPSWGQVVKLAPRPAVVGTSSGPRLGGVPVISHGGPGFATGQASTAAIVPAARSDVDALRETIRELHLNQQRLETEVTRLRRAPANVDGGGGGSGGSMMQLQLTDDLGSSGEVIRQVADHGQQLEVHQAALIAIQAELGAKGHSFVLVGGQTTVRRWFDTV